MELCESGHAPHVRVDGKEGFFFQRGIIKAWAKENILRFHPGAPIVNKFDVFELYPSEDGHLPPGEIAAIGGLKFFPLSAAFPPAIYFLCKRKKVVYVGQTINLHSRIGEHRITGKDFDEVFYLPVPRSELLRVERELIIKLRPELNREKIAGDRSDAF